MDKKTLLIVGLVALSMVVAVTTVAAAKTELVMWVGAWLCQDISGEDQVYRLEELFEAEYPDIDLKIVCIPWVGLLDKHLLAAQTGDLPDLIWGVGNLGWLSLFVAYGNFLNLDELMEEIGEDRFFPGTLEKYQGHYYAIPYRNSTRVFLYNKDMFQEAGLDPNRPPETWAEVLEYAQKLTRDIDGDGSTDQWGFTYPVARFDTICPEYLRAVMSSYGADILNEDITECTINTPEAVEAIRFYTDLVTKYHVVTPDAISHDNGDDMQTFLNGLSAMVMTGPWTVETLDHDYPDLDYGVTTIPSNEPGVVGKFCLTYCSWMVPKNTEHKEEVFELIKYIVRPEVNAWFADSAPTVRASWEEPAFTSRYKKPEMVVALSTQMGNSTPNILAIPQGPQIAREVNVAVQRIILGMDLETVLNEAKVIIDELLAE